MAGMGYSLETHSGTSAAADSRSAFDSSGWSINFGSGKVSSVTGGAIPQWVWIAGAIGAVVWLQRKR
jgi:hypothetical protein